MKKVLLVICAALAACDSPAVPERTLRDIYEFRLLTPAPRTLRWPAGTTISLFVTSDADALRTRYLSDAVTHAVQAWNAAALYGEVKLVRVDNVESADVVVQYTPAVSPVVLADCPPGGGFAYTTFCLTPDQEHLVPFPLTAGGASNVKFVVTVRATSATDAVNVRRLVTHEIGHVLGLAQHSNRQTDLMYAGVLSVDVPSPADRATLHVLYHTVPDITP